MQIASHFTKHGSQSLSSLYSLVDDGMDSIVIHYDPMSVGAHAW